MNRFVIFLILIAPVLTCNAQEASKIELEERLQRAEQLRVDLIEKVSPASVCVFSTDGQGGGSGVLIDRSGLALSNYHVVEPCGFHMYCGLNDGKIYDAVVVGLDPVGDLALIQLFGRDDFPAATFGDSDKTDVGQECFAVGNPFLLSNDFSPTVTWGIVSGKNRYQYPSGTLLEYPDCIQTDAAINPGNSGGGLFNTQGQLIGINGRGSFEKRGRVNVGVGYAISINQVKNFVGSLKSGRILDHSTLEFVVSTGSDYSVRINRLPTQSLAYRLGIRYDDVLVSLAGRQVTNVNDVKNIIGTLPPHWSIPVVIRQGDEKREFLLRLQPTHSRQELLTKTGENGPNTTNDRPMKKIPDSVKKRYEKRTGYSNYFFQKQNVSRVINGLERRYNPLALKNPRIRLTGKSRLDPVAFVMAEGKSGIKIGDEAGTLAAELPFENQTVPKRSGGFLNALHLYNELLFSDRSTLAIEYMGTAPFACAIEKKKLAWSPNNLFDVLKIIRDGTSAFVYINDKSELLAIEYLAFPNAIPCVVQFDQTITFDDNSTRAPRYVTAVRGGRIFAAIEFAQCDFESVDRSKNSPNLGKEAK